ncbi:glutathione S-transferase family protein [Magnetospirillum sp. 64-120]|uniref:FtsZ-binding protein FzlA n=1 Tax=Magnetospirillum sp. 64-120 TaxID=1895778 RepID=UPI0009285E4A|nr:glutathione S-transferase family protein [Magnetospirillum sp. 64-120]OJX70410.1 MAG: glutathione S-transferase [Magnetospirillum sp. 64-120]
MRKLYHYPLCPFSRKVRIVLAEKKLECVEEIEKYWERRDEFLAISPGGDLPVLVEEGGTVLGDSNAICEYLDEVHREPPLLPAEAEARAEVRRLVGWFDRKFHDEVTRNLVDEKVTKRLTTLKGSPDSRAIRAGFANIHQHLEYVAWLTERRTWLAGSNYTLADVAAAAQISCIDYIGDVPWDRHPGAKDWYARVKSRPSFRALLADHLPGVPPPKHYPDLDF